MVITQETASVSTMDTNHDSASSNHGDGLRDGAEMMTHPF